MWNYNANAVFGPSVRSAAPPLPGEQVNKPEPLDWNLISVLDPEIIRRVKDIDSLQKLITHFCCANFTPGCSKILSHPLSLRLCQLLQIGIQTMNDGQEQLKKVITDNKETVSKINHAAKKLKSKLEQTENKLKQKSVPYDKCPVCQKKFSNLDYVDRHMLNRHNELSECWDCLRGRKDPKKSSEMQKVYDELVNMKEEIKNGHMVVIQHVNNNNNDNNNLDGGEHADNEKQAEDSEDENAMSVKLGEELSAISDDLGKSLKLWHQQRDRFDIFNKNKNYVLHPSIAQPSRPFFIQETDLQLKNPFNRNGVNCDFQLRDNEDNHALDLFVGLGDGDKDKMNEYNKSEGRYHENLIDDEQSIDLPTPADVIRIMKLKNKDESTPKSEGDIKRAIASAKQFLFKPSRPILESVRHDEVNESLTKVRFEKEKESKRLVAGACGDFVSAVLAKQALSLHNSDYLEIREYIRHKLISAYPLTNDEKYAEAQPAPKYIQDGKITSFNVDLIHTGLLPYPDDDKNVKVDVKNKVEILVKDRLKMKKPVKEVKKDFEEVLFEDDSTPENSQKTNGTKDGKRKESVKDSKSLKMTEEHSDNEYSYYYYTEEPNNDKNKNQEGEGGTKINKSEHGDDSDPKHEAAKIEENEPPVKQSDVRDKPVPESQDVRESDKEIKDSSHMREEDKVIKSASHKNEEDRTIMNSTHGKGEDKGIRSIRKENDDDFKHGDSLKRNEIDMDSFFGPPSFNESQPLLASTALKASQQIESKIQKQNKLNEKRAMNNNLPIKWDSTSELAPNPVTKVSLNSSKTHADEEEVKPVGFSGKTNDNNVAQNPSPAPDVMHDFPSIKLAFPTSINKKLQVTRNDKNDSDAEKNTAISDKPKLQPETQGSKSDNNDKFIGKDLVPTKVNDSPRRQHGDEDDNVHKSFDINEITDNVPSVSDTEPSFDLEMSLSTLGREDRVNKTIELKMDGVKPYSSPRSNKESFTEGESFKCSDVMESDRTMGNSVASANDKHDNHRNQANQKENLGSMHSSANSSMMQKKDKLKMLMKRTAEDDQEESGPIKGLSEEEIMASGEIHITQELLKIDALGSDDTDSLVELADNLFRPRLQLPKKQNKEEPPSKQDSSEGSSILLGNRRSIYDNVNSSQKSSDQRKHSVVKTKQNTFESGVETSYKSRK